MRNIRERYCFHTLSRSGSRSSRDTVTWIRCPSCSSRDTVTWIRCPSCNIFIGILSQFQGKHPDNRYWINDIRKHSGFK
ncbi:myogenin isoform X2 [Pseudophryne corroboree]|uniref:myogenin isoform X2 n=1 Tax=Pseudophryne corroboree TaxID=495146 RepID=UPI0030812AC2